MAHFIINEVYFYFDFTAFSINTIFDKLKDQKIFIITVDTPFVSIDSISKLISESKDVDICIAQTEKTHNLCGVFSSTISSTIKNMIENDIHKIAYLIRNNKFKMIHFHDDKEFLNINNKDDYEKSFEYKVNIIILITESIYYISVLL